MPLNIPDYIADTLHLGPLQSGAYMFLIMHYWQHGRLPNDDEALRRITRMTEKEWRDNRAVLRAFFKEPGWTHKRVDLERAKTAALSEKRRAAAMHRHGKPATNGHAHA
jgi:uncharacterized protein YdaU (DUF1376 family)